MAKPTTREEFKQYCLRKLGAPVIQINVSDEQIDDRVDQAISFWSDYFYDGSEHVYLKHQITQEDIDRKFVQVPEKLLGVVRILNLNSSIGSGGGMFNVKYQFVLNNINDLSGFTMQNYYMAMQHLQSIQEILVGVPMIRYNRHINKMHLDMDASNIAVGDYIIIEAYSPLDEDMHSDMWNDRWLQNYATTLIKEQWGSVLTKFNNMQLVGGIQFNGDQILSDAVEERKRLEEEAINSLQPLIYNFSG